MVVGSAGGGEWERERGGGGDTPVARTPGLVPRTFSNNRTIPHVPFGEIQRSRRIKRELKARKAMERKTGARGLRSVVETGKKGEESQRMPKRRSGALCACGAVTVVNPRGWVELEGVQTPKNTSGRVLDPNQRARNLRCVHMSRRTPRRRCLTKTYTRRGTRWHFGTLAGLRCIRWGSAGAGAPANQCVIIVKTYFGSAQFALRLFHPL
jgi:hypothetical protein